MHLDLAPEFHRQIRKCITEVEMPEQLDLFGPQFPQDATKGQKHHSVLSYLQNTSWQTPLSKYLSCIQHSVLWCSVCLKSDYPCLCRSCWSCLRPFVVRVAHALERAIVSSYAFLDQSDLPSNVLTILSRDARGICNLFVTSSLPYIKLVPSLYYYFQQNLIIFIG